MMVIVAPLTSAGFSGRVFAPSENHPRGSMSAFKVLCLFIAVALTACDDAKTSTITDVCQGASCDDTDTGCVGAACDVVEADCVGAGCGMVCVAPGRCDGTTFVSCVAGQETGRQDCSELGAAAYCSADGCVASCTSGEVVCQGGAAGHPFECQAAGLTQTATCSPDEHCTDGACVADICTQGTTTCEGGHPFTCDADGTSSSQSATCTTTEQCQDGACVAVITPPSGSCAAISEAIAAATGPTITLRPAGAGRVDNNGSITTLRSVLTDAAAGTTILLEDGTYTFDESDGSSYTGIYITTPNLTLRSVSGNPNAVLVDSNYADHGGETALVTVAAPGFTIAGITLERSIFHLIHIWNGGDDVRIHNMHLVDGGEQFVKTSPGTGNRITGGTVTCSTFLMTPEGRRNAWGYGAADGAARCYTGGIDTHDTDNWVVSDNVFEGIYCESTGGHPEHGKKRDNVEFATYVGGLAEHAIHMWDGGPGTTHVIERNRIINCARGIGLGLGATLRVHGAIVRNNMIFSEHPGSSEHDVGIMIEGSQNVRALNNTVFFSNANAYSNAIEYRFDTTTGTELANNLTNKQIQLRNNAQGTLTTNITNAQESWFVGPTTGDLHLGSCTIAEVDGVGTALTEVSDDFDGEARGANPDLGADECTN